MHDPVLHAYNCHLDMIAAGMKLNYSFVKNDCRLTALMSSIQLAKQHESIPQIFLNYKRNVQSHK